MNPGLHFSLTPPHLALGISTTDNQVVAIVIVKNLDNTSSKCQRDITLNSLQWSLRITDTLGPGILSFIERLSSLRRLKMY